LNFLFPHGKEFGTCLALPELSNCPGSVFIATALAGDGEPA